MWSSRDEVAVRSQMRAELYRPTCLENRELNGCTNGPSGGPPERSGHTSVRHPREVLRGPPYSRPFPYRRQNEPGSRRSPRRGITPHGQRRAETASAEVPLAPAQTRRESQDRTALPPPRSAPL